MCDKHLKEDLLRMINHNPSTPYQCPVPGCNYTTKDSRQALVRHYGMTHKVVQTILAQKFPDFMATDKFQAPPKPSSSRNRSKTPVGGAGRMNSPGMGGGYDYDSLYRSAAPAANHLAAAHLPYSPYGSPASSQHSGLAGLYGGQSPVSHHQSQVRILVLNLVHC